MKKNQEKSKFILLCLAVVLSAFFFCGCACKKSVIAVSGTGTVMAQPDIVQMQISLNKTAATSRKALDEVNAMVRKALKILEDSGIESKNISTASLRFNPEYDWGGARRVLLGQKAEQIITFSANINYNDGTETSRVSNIIDQLILIDGIELQQMNFSVKNTSELFAKSRELAYQKALEKAEQFANLSGMKIIKTSSIAEEGNQAVSPIFNRAVNNSMTALSAQMDSLAGSTVLPTGELEITSRICVEFLLK